MRKTLADLLREESIVPDEALQAGMKRARRHGIPLGVALLEEGRVTEEALVGLLERRLKLPRFDPATAIVEPEAVREIAYNLAATRCLLPLAIERQGGLRALRVAMVDPLDDDAVEEIESSTGCRLEPVLATPSELEPAIERAYRGVVTRLIPRKAPLGAEGAPLPLEDNVTQPQRRIEDAAPFELRLRALVQVLVDKGLLTDEEYAEALRRLVRGGET